MFKYVKIFKKSRKLIIIIATLKAKKREIVHLI